MRCRSPWARSSRRRNRAGASPRAKASRRYDSRAPLVRLVVVGSTRSSSLWFRASAALRSQYRLLRGPLSSSQGSEAHKPLRFHDVILTSTTASPTRMDICRWAGAMTPSRARAASDIRLTAHLSGPIRRPDRGPGPPRRAPSRARRWFARRCGVGSRRAAR
jgi:hypothetical protein